MAGVSDVVFARFVGTLFGSWLSLFERRDSGCLAGFVTGGGAEGGVSLLLAAGFLIIEFLDFFDGASLLPSLLLFLPAAGLLPPFDLISKGGGSESKGTFRSSPAGPAAVGSGGQLDNPDNGPPLSSLLERTCIESGESGREQAGEIGGLLRRDCGGDGAGVLGREKRGEIGRDGV
jgi:hypothetical protein